MEIFYLQVHAHPEEWHPDFGSIRGAYVNCWIKASTEADARQIAYSQIRHEKWNIDEVVVPAAVAVKPSNEVLERWLQANMDGECYVFHTYSGSESEADFHAAGLRKLAGH